jgi:subtilase-type serine protease
LPTGVDLQGNLSHFPRRIAWGLFQKMTGTLRLAGRIAALLVSTALSATLTAPAFAQSAGDSADPAAWRTPEYLAQWGLDLIDAADAYALGLDGSGVKVGVVDSGIDPNHPEFHGRVGGGYDYVVGSPNLIDSNGHGTMVGSVIAANRDGVGMHGVAPGATIISARILKDNGSYADNFESIVGPIWGDLIAQGARIINNSWGTYYIPVTDYTALEVETSRPGFVAAARSAVAAGGLMIFSAGNDGLASPDVESGLPYLFPELERGWLAVAAVTPTHLANWSDRCGVAMNWCLVAPGGGDWRWNPETSQWEWPDSADIMVAVPGGDYRTAWGTSFAAPHVAGAAALVSQMFPYMTMDQLRQVLLGTAWDVGDPGVDELFGYGVLDVGKAVLGPGKFDWGDFHAAFDEGRSVWENDITGAGGLIKSGGGVLILTGDSVYLGDTHANGGVLAIGGSIASQTFIGPEGTLAGNGAIFGDVDNSGAVYAGWNSDGGTLTVDGNYRQRGNSWLLVELGAPDGTSRLDVTGAATIEGGAVDVGFESGGYRGDARHTILSAGAGVTGRFEEVCNCYAFLDFDLAYDPTNVYLDVARNAVAFAAVAPTRNGAAAAQSIEKLGIGNSVHDAIITLGAGDAGDAFTQLSGELHASVSGTLIETSGMLNSAASSRLRSAFADSGAPTLPVMAYGPGGPELATADTERLAVWTEALGAWGGTDGDGNAAGPGPLDRRRAFRRRRGIWRQLASRRSRRLQPYQL